MNQAFDTSWKIRNEIRRWLSWPWIRIQFLSMGIRWGQGWRIHGRPIIQKHRKSKMKFGNYLNLRSTVQSNPLGPNHPVTLCTWEAGALLQIGDEFGMTGGSIVAAKQITIGNRVTVGPNCTIMDTDFHPLNPDKRRRFPKNGETIPIIIEDDVFIGMNSLVLKGVTIGSGSVIGAGSVVVKDVPSGMVSVGNPAKVVGQVIK